MLMTMKHVTVSGVMKSKSNNIDKILLGETSLSYIAIIVHRPSVPREIPVTDARSNTGATRYVQVTRGILSCRRYANTALL